MPRPIDEPISSLDNPHVRRAHALLEPAGRRRFRAFLVEGLRLVAAAAAYAPPQLVLHTPTFGQADARERSLLRHLRGTGAPVRPVDQRVLAHVTDTVTPQGIVAVMPLPGAATPATGGTPALAQRGGGDRERARPVSPEAGGAPLVLVLDALGDPGNAGTLLRSAAGAGVSAVLATPGTVDLFSPMVGRAGAGAHFQVPVRMDVRWPDLPDLLPAGCCLWLADAQAETPYWAVDWTQPAAVVVGSEAHGASAGARAAATGTIAIPAYHVESLNAAVAGSVILFEALRQRRAHREGPSVEHLDTEILRAGGENERQRRPYRAGPGTSDLRAAGRGLREARRTVNPERAR